MRDIENKYIELYAFLKQFSLDKAFTKNIVIV